MEKNDIIRKEFQKILSHNPAGEVYQAELELSRMYKTHLGKEAVNYDMPKYRMAYMFKYHDTHAQVTRMALRIITNASKRCTQHLNQEKASPFNSRTFFLDLERKQLNHCLVVTSIGGGAGSDLEGFYLFWSKDLKRENRNLILTNIDCYGGWRECSSNYMSLLQTYSYDFITANVFDGNVSIVQQQLESSDLVIMCRFISAVYHSDGLMSNFQRMVRNMKPRAYFLFIDNMYPGWGVHCLAWMKTSLQNEDFVLLLNYGNSAIQEGVGYDITLDDDLQEEINFQYTKYLREFPFLNPYVRVDPMKSQEQLKQKLPKGVGFQLWQRI